MYFFDEVELLSLHSVLRLVAIFAIIIGDWILSEALDCTDFPNMYFIRITCIWHVSLRQCTGSTALVLLWVGFIPIASVLCCVQEHFISFLFSLPFFFFCLLKQNVYKMANISSLQVWKGSVSSLYCESVWGKVGFACCSSIFLLDRVSLHSQAILVPALQPKLALYSSCLILSSIEVIVVSRDIQLMGCFLWQTHLKNILLKLFVFLYCLDRFSFSF